MATLAQPLDATLNRGRLASMRLNFIARQTVIRRLAVVNITMNGQPLRVRAGSMTIRDVLNDAPNTCSFIDDNATPPSVGGRLVVTAGIPLQTTVLFSGTIQKATQVFVGKPGAVLAWQVEATDDTWRGDWIRPFGQFDNSPADIVASYLITNYAPPGLNTIAVQSGLPGVTLVLDGTTRFNDVMQQICRLIGGYFYWDNGVLHLFVNPEAGLTPDPIDGAPGRFQLADPSFAFAVDDAQIRTRTYGKGHGENTLTAIDAGETRIPIANAVMFTSAGGKAIVGAQRLAYTGTVIGGTGALVGPGVAPSAPLVVAAVSGTGVNAGAHNYAMTWVTATGETMPSPVAAITVSTTPPTPTLESVTTGSLQNGPPVGTVMQYQLFISDGNNLSYGSNIITITSTGNFPVVNFRTTVDMRGRYVYPYRNDGGGWFPIAIQGAAYGFGPYPINLSPGQLMTMTDHTVTSSVNPPPNVGRLIAAQVAVTGIAVGPSQTTARRVYRTQANATTLQLVATVADNTTTTYTDATPDASLGVAAPGGDTSGLQMPAGQIAVGAASMPVSSAGWALPGGGWAVVGNGQVVIKYAGVSGNTITGIPPSGNGSIVAPITYNSTITGAPMLTGVTWNPPVTVSPYAVPADQPVSIWVQRDDVAAQQALAQRYPSGIVENMIVDGRRGEPSLTALCDADLAMYSRPIITVQYATMDPKSKSGRPVYVNMPGIVGTLTIQDVTIDHFGAGPLRFNVTASTLTMSLESILRNMVDGLATLQG